MQGIPIRPIDHRHAAFVKAAVCHDAWDLADGRTRAPSPPWPGAPGGFMAASPSWCSALEEQPNVPTLPLDQGCCAIQLRGVVAVVARRHRRIDICLRTRPCPAHFAAPVHSRRRSRADTSLS